MQAFKQYSRTHKPYQHLIHCAVLLLLLLCPPANAMDLTSEPISPIQADSHLNPEKVSLGRVLFHDPRLSSDSSISCASCHNLSKGGADTSAVSRGVGGAQGSANTPTVYNSGLNFVQFWNGRAADLNEQVNGPVHNPVEMNSNWPKIVNRLNQDPAIRQRFESLYPDGINGANIRNAITQFERSLSTLNAPFDRWLKGDESALSAEQKHGYRLFKSYGCISCHQGTNVGGNMYAPFGAVKDISEYFNTRSTPLSDTDLGRYTATNDAADRYLFKVPSLRMASVTAPYFHDGAVKELKTAIEIMGRFQLGREIPAEHISAISSFITSLKGEHPELQQ
ncbi:cytochrome c peroxidase [Amphritea atlantica]|uniref:Cytochrome c peroxidase n=1 Tax=Amphritea atlantica TaxID=355243 RepID=A0A1H9H8Z1_9GAMM|nr:cytochrome c peroxidase [Amphritea atlantica]SEQ58707.1 cytochrome c peroxidase [Amphritea atlantica]